MARIVQISDTHLSAQKAHFASNWAPLAGWVRQQRPDLIVHSGDVTLDGAGVEADMEYCRELLPELGSTVLCLPGNHDVGDAHDRYQPADRARVERWRRHFGPDYWHHDIEGWRLIGLDAMIFGTDDGIEAEQRRWLETAMSQADGRRIAWFLHKPLFLETPDEPDTGYWSVKPRPRADLLSIVHEYRVALVASGHVHTRHATSVDGVQYVWCPAGAFVCGPVTQPTMPGERVLGAVLYEFDPDSFTFSFADINGLTHHCIDDVLQEVYPAPVD
jgi:3',5'-cyclic AMP phosphodiesterase CpdA